MKNNSIAMLLGAAVSLFATTSVCNAAIYQIDTSFANSGRFNLGNGGSDFRTLAHLPRQDGTSIAVVAYRGSGCPAMRHCLALVPFNAAGQSQGVITVPTNISFSQQTGGIVLDPYLVRAAAIDSQGRIVIAGTEQFGTVFQFKVVRLQPNGLADTTFDGDGIATPGSFTSANEDFAEAVAIDASDRIVVAGRTKFASADTDFAVLRLTSAGALDTTFATTGKRRIAFDLAGAGYDGATAVGIRPGGQIYLAGTAADGNITRVALAKLLPDGSLAGNFCDTTCTYQGPYTAIHNGRRVLYYGYAEDNLSDYVRSLAVNVSGEMVYAGYHSTGGSNFRIFTQKVALNGDWVTEGLTDVGLSGSLQYRVGGIRYFNPNNAMSKLVLTGSVGPNTEFLFAQGLDANLVPTSNWGGSGEYASVLLYTATGAFGDNGGDLPTTPSIDTNARVLLGASYKATSTGFDYSINIMRLRSDVIFRNGFE